MRSLCCGPDLRSRVTGVYIRLRRVYACTSLGVPVRSRRKLSGLDWGENDDGGEGQKVESCWNLG